MNIYLNNGLYNGFLIALIFLLGLSISVWRKKRRKSYLILFILFGLYLLFVLRITIFPIPLYSHIRLDKSFFAPYNFNLIPFYFGECQILRYCIFGSVANIYLTIPFGFGIHFLKTLNKKERLWLILIGGISIEITQLLISLGLGYPYRVIDINDVIFNTIGVLLGIIFFKLFVRIYIAMSKKWKFLSKGWFSYLFEVASKVSTNKIG